MEANKVPQIEPEADPVQSAVDATDRLLAAFESLQAQDGEITPEPAPLETPASAETKLDAARAQYEQTWETEAAKSTPQTPAQIREKLAREGLRPNSPTSEEIEAAEQQHSARLRAATEPTVKKTTTPRKAPKRYGPRDSGAPAHIARQMRVE